MAGTPEEWFRSLPPVTRAYLVAALLTTTSFALGLIDIMNLVLIPQLVWQKFQVWRLVTCFIFLGKFSFSFIINLMILVRYSAALEQNPYCTTPRATQGSTADFVYMLMLGALVLLLPVPQSQAFHRYMYRARAEPFFRESGAFCSVSSTQMLMHRAIHMMFDR